MKMKKWQYIALVVYAVATVALLFVATISTAGLETGVFGTAWSLMPPVLAIGLALITKEVYLSLFAGVFAGGILAAGSIFRPMQAVEITFKMIQEKLGDSWNVGILVFLVFLGAMVAVINKAGGSRLWRLGEGADQEPRACAADDVFPGRADLRGRLLQLPDGRLRHAPGDR